MLKASGLKSCAEKIVHLWQAQTNLPWLRTMYNKIKTSDIGLVSSRISLSEIRLIFISYKLHSRKQRASKMYI